MPRKPSSKPKPPPPFSANPANPSKPPPTFGYADMFDLDALQKKVSKAIAAHLGLMWDKKTEAAIKAEVGDEGWAMVREIDDFANRADFWQYAPSHDRAYQNIQSQLASKYPFRSQPAISRLATRAAWGWR